MREIVLFATLFYIKFRYLLEDEEKMWAWFITALVPVIFGLVVWGYRRAAERERQEAAAAQIKAQFEAELAKNHPKIIDGYDCNFLELMAKEDAPKPEPKRVEPPKGNPTLREMLDERARKRAEAEARKAAAGSAIWRFFGGGGDTSAGPSTFVREDYKTAEREEEKTAEPEEEIKQTSNDETARPSSRRTKKRAIDQVADYQDHERDTSTRRISRRLPKRNRRESSEEEEGDVSMITLPGGLGNIEVLVRTPDAGQRESSEEEGDVSMITLPGGLGDIEVLVKTPDAGGRRKRRAEDSGEEREESEEEGTSRRRRKGRAVRRRREGSGDQEMTVVQGSSRRSKRASTNGKERKEFKTDPDSELKRLRATPFDHTNTDDPTSESDSQSKGGDSRLTPRQRSKLPATGSRKTGARTAETSRKARAAAAAIEKRAKTATPARVRGEMWTEKNGRQFKISARDGKKRELVQVREWRHKYHMPADSLHPDKDVMHQITIERWLLPHEVDDLQRCKMLGWQSDTEESGMDDHEETHGIGEAKEDPPDEQTQLNNSLYNFRKPQYVVSPETKAALEKSLSGSRNKVQHLNKLQYFDPASLRPQTQLRAHRREPALGSSSVPRNVGSYPDSTRNTTGMQDGGTQGDQQQYHSSSDVDMH